MMGRTTLWVSQRVTAVILGFFCGVAGGAMFDGPCRSAGSRSPCHKPRAAKVAPAAVSPVSNPTRSSGPVVTPADAKNEVVAHLRAEGRSAMAEGRWADAFRAWTVLDGLVPGDAEAELVRLEVEEEANKRVTTARLLTRVDGHPDQIRELLKKAQTMVPEDHPTWVEADALLQNLELVE